MRRIVVLLLLLQSSLLGARLQAQVDMQPTPPPRVSAASEEWYVNRVPIVIDGDNYYFAGAVRPFNGDEMVRSGFFGSIPIYVDVTIEPFSVVYVPIGGGLLQPYERKRTGQIAGTEGSRTPSFPVQLAPLDFFYALPLQAASPGIGPLGGTVNQLAVRRVVPVFGDDEGPPPEPVVGPSGPLFGPVGPSGQLGPSVPVGPSGPIDASSLPPGFAGTSGQQTWNPWSGYLATAVPPTNNDGVWISWEGKTWVNDGRAVPFEEAQFKTLGGRYGFPVFAAVSGPPGIIYYPSRDGFVAPYRVKR
jgi:hypothetical protein